MDAVHARGRQPRVRRLEAVVTYPVLLPDGTLLATNGYHRRSGILVGLPPDLRLVVPDAPKPEDVTMAVEVLLDPLADFPFETPAHRAALVASLLTPLAWFAFTGTAPLFLIDKNVRGAGGGLMADVVGLPDPGDTGSRSRRPPTATPGRWASPSTGWSGGTRSGGGCRPPPSSPE